MKADTRRTIAMARRALEFALAHPQADSGYTAVVTRLQQEVAETDTVAAIQQSGVEREHAGVARRLELRNAVRSQHLIRLTRLARRGAKEHPELAGRFTMPPGNAPHQDFLVKANSMLADAITQKDLLSTIGLGDSFVDELTQAITEVEQATADSHVARNDHVGAAAQLEQLAAVASIDVAVLDTFMKRIYDNDPMALAAWNSAKNVEGPFRSRADSSGTVPEPAPLPVPAPAPVAPPASQEPGT
ncbi:MAG TPA: hypothetical protein VGL65_14120 [Gemmatimonadales bacterium]